MTEQEAAQKIIDKILNMTNPPRCIGVFVGKEKNTINMTRPNSEVFSKAIRMRLNDFCGVYDERATVEMITEDLRYSRFCQ